MHRAGILNPPDHGEYRVFNQFTEQFTVKELADKAFEAAKGLGIDAHIENLENPRVELEKYYFNAKHTRLLDLGLEPHYLSDSLLDSLVGIALEHRDRVDERLMRPRVNWRTKRDAVGPAASGVPVAAD